MKRLAILALIIFLVQGLSAQNTKCGGALEFIGMCHGEAGMPMDYDKDTSFSFYYYKDKKMYDFALIKSGNDLTFKSYTSFKNEQCKMVDIDKKYLPEVLTLFKRYKDWRDSRWDKENRRSIPYDYPPGITPDSIKASYKRLDQCDGVGQINTTTKLTMDLSYWNDDDQILNTIDDIRLKLFKDLIAFTKKVNQ